MQTHASSTYLLLLLVIGHVWVVSGCGGDAGENPIHHHVVCGSRADGQTESCASPERVSLFNSWVTEAIHRPHSTFSIWTVGPARHQCRHVFTACIPTQWPASVWKTKADFIMRSRQGLSSTQQGLVVPDDCRPAERKKTPGIHQLTVRPAVAPFMGDAVRTLVSPPVAPPMHVAIACIAQIDPGRYVYACRLAACVRSLGGRGTCATGRLTVSRDDRPAPGFPALRL